MQIEILLHFSFSRQNKRHVTILTVHCVLKFPASRFSSATRNRTSGYTNNNQCWGVTDCFHACVFPSRTKRLFLLLRGLWTWNHKITGPSRKVHSKFLAKFKPKGLKIEYGCLLGCLYQVTRRYNPYSYSPP